MRRRPKLSGMMLIMACVWGLVPGIAQVANADTWERVNFAAGAPIQCVNFEQAQCIKVNDGNRYTYGQSMGLKADTIATVDVILPLDAYVTDLYWEIVIYISWGSPYAQLQIRQGDDDWVAIAEAPGGIGGGTVELGSATRITQARIVATSGNHTVFGNIYRVYELEVWGDAAEPLPDDYFDGYPRWSEYGADPVNTSTGNFTHKETDLSIASRGLALEFSRHYNSRNSKPGPLGPAWTHSYNIVLEDGLPDDQVTVRWGDGRTVYWTDDLQGGYEPTYAGCNDVLVKNGDGTWMLTRKNLEVYRFDSGGRLTSIADQNENTITLAYNDPSVPDFVTGVTDPAGRTLVLDFNSNGLLGSVTDFASPPRTVQYSYTGGRLTQVTDALGNTIGYGYNGNGYLETLTDQRGVTTVTNIYDGEGRVIEQRDGQNNATTFQYNTPAQDQTTVTQTVTVEGVPRTVQHIHTYRERKKLLLSSENSLGHSVAFTYDDDNNRNSITDRNGNTTQFTHDSRGNVTSTTELDDPTDPNDGGVTTVEHNDSRFPDLPTRAIDPGGYITEWAYDSHGNKLTEVRWLDAEQTESVTKSWTYNGYGQRLTETDERGNVHQWIYDADGLLVEEIDREGNHTWHGYDELWRRVWKTDGRGSGPEDPAYTTHYVYDDADRRIGATGPPVGLSTNGITWAYAYDGVGNRTSVINGEGDTCTYFYDLNNNLTRVVEPLDGDPMGRVTRHEYDELNRRVLMIDANSNAIHYKYDDRDRLIEIKDARGNLWAYSYDPHGNMLARTDPSGVTTTHEHDALHRETLIRDELNNEKQFEYDKLGWLTREINADAKETGYSYDALGRLTCVIDAGWGWTQYWHDESGNLIEIEDANAHVISLREYDAMNRLIWAEDGNGNVYDYAYDAVGNQTWVRDAREQETFLAFDAENRLIQIDYPDATTVTYDYDNNGNRIEMTDANGLSSFTYDKLNRLRSGTDSFGRQVQYDYDAAGNRTLLTYPDGNQVTYSYDSANRLTAIADWASRVTQYGYHGTQLETVTYPNGVVETWGYDDAGRVTSLGTQDAGSNGLLGFAWARGGEGNPLSVTETGTLPQPPPEQAVIDYEYDTDNRLVGSSQGSFEFNSNGNLISRTVQGVTTTFAYDSEERLVSQATGGDMVQHVYDGDGCRIARIENGVSTAYVLDRSQSMSHLLCEVNTNGEIIAYYIQGPQLVARIGADGTQRYYHTNDIGSVVGLTDQNGQITDRYGYTPFGVLVAREGATPNPFTYVGGLGVMADADGLYFMRARFYDPNTGRFLGKDPLQGTPADPRSLHRYVYGFNRPVLLVDPTGLFPDVDLSELLEFIKDQAAELARDLGLLWAQVKLIAAGHPVSGAAAGALRGILSELSAALHVWEIAERGISVLDRLENLDMSEAAKKGYTGKDLSDSLMKQVMKDNFESPAWGIDFDD
ncbi:MAG: RHS repeat protein [Phycisphaerae bacterium]|nr:RHS repeat protein [Phycisphaerae bacterium]